MENRVQYDKVNKKINNNITKIPELLNQKSKKNKKLKNILSSPILDISLNTSNKNSNINKKSNILYDYLKNGRFDYSLDSNSNSNKEENQKDKIKEKKSKKQNFILKSELFNSSPNIEQKIRSEKLSPKSSVLK